MGRFTAYRAVRLAAFLYIGMVAALAFAADDAALVRQLGDPSYAARREATQQLLTAGPAAEAALRAGLKHSDPEIRRRCRWLLEEVASIDFARRRETFIADKEGRDGHGLPCWKAFDEIAGKEAHARELFVEMLRSEPALLQAAAEGHALAAKALTERLQMTARPIGMFDPAFTGSDPQYSKGTLAAVWLVLSQCSTDKGDNENGMPGNFGNQLTQQPEFHKLMQDARLGKPMQRLVGRWLLAPGPQEQVYERLDVAVRYQLREGVAIAVKVLRNKDHVVGNYRSHAVMAIGALGGKPYAGLLQELLGETRDVSSRRRAGNNAWISDLALAWLIHITEQDHAAYGLPKAKAAIAQILKGTTSISENPLAEAFEFKDDGKRKEALKKWQEYVAKNPLPELPPDVPKASKNKTPTEKPTVTPADPFGAPSNDELSEERPAKEMPEKDAFEAPAPPRDAPAPQGSGPLGDAVRLPGAPIAVPLAAAAAPLGAAAHAGGPIVPTGPTLIPSHAANDPFAEPAPDELLPRAAAPSLIPRELSTLPELPDSDDPLVEPADELLLEVEPKRKPAVMRWPPADRGLVRQLSIAREAATGKHYARAARLVDEVLMAAGNSIFVPDRKAPLVRSLHAEAERVIRDWPAAGRQAYALRFNAEAAETLAQAARGGDVELMASVAERWFHTPAGAEASLLVGVHAFARGDVFHAAYRLERIRRHSLDADRLEPALSLRLAVCWLQLGERRQAEAVLHALQQKHPQFAAKLAGLEQPTALSLDAICKRLELQLHASTLGDGGPPVYSAWDAKQTAAAVGMPWLKPEALPVPKLDPRLATAIARFRKEDEAKHRAALPAAPPLVIGNTALLRTATHLVALNLANGELLWETPLEDRLQHYLRLNPPPAASEPARKSLLGARLKSLFTGEPLPDARRNEQLLAQGMRNRLWHDRSFGALTSDGRRVFGVEHLPVHLPDDYQRLVVGPRGERAFDVGQPSHYNFLTAYDVATGKLLWEVGGPPAAESPQRQHTPPDLRTVPRGAVQFLGPPLPVAGRLFALAEAHCATYLIEIRPEDGHLTSALMLSSRLPVRRYTALGEDYVEDGEASAGGGSCALADGVLVCHNGAGKFFGVDMATRSFLWAYPLMELEPEPQEDDDEGPFIEPEIFANVEIPPDNRWVDCGAVVAGDRALLTSPNTQTLDCLRLTDGKVLWSAPRRDGLYVGAVDRDRAIVVDRGGVRCLRLADGRSAWPVERLALPDGAVPCGRGYASGGAFYVPLRPAAVLAIDIERGRVLARHRGREAAPVGNLVAFGSGVVVQTADGLFRCATLAQGAPQLAAELAARPDDPEVLTRHSEALMAAGRWPEAVAAMRRALKLRPTGAAQRDLAEAVIDALRADFARFAPLAEEIEPELADRARAHLLREMAVGYQAAGQHREAFARYLKMSAGADLTQLERIETVREVRLDCWLAARLSEVYRAAAPDDRVMFDRALAARWRDDKLAEQVLLFGWHRSSVAARLKLAQLSETARQPHLADWQLSAAQPLADDAQRAEVVRRLDKLAVVTRRPAVVWPQGKVEKQFEAQSNLVTQSVALPITGDAGHDGGGLALRYDGANDQLVGYDADGRERWRSTALAPAVDGGFYGGLSQGWRGWRLGRLLVVEAGGRICALDALGQKGDLLWCRQPEVTDAVAAEVAAMGIESAPPDLPGGERLAVSVGRQAVCFQIGARLYGVEPLSGATLWMRDDLPGGCDLFGDDEALLVTAPDSSEALVLSPVDGRDLGSCSVPPRDERLWTVGRDAVLWKAGNERVQLLRVDPWHKATAWQRTFAAQSRVFLVDGDLAAVCEPTGKVSLVRLTDGRNAVTLLADAAPNVKSLAVIRGSTQWIVLLSTSTGGGDPAGMFGWGQLNRGQFDITGRVYAFDRAGKRQWACDVANQSLRLYQPADVPVLAFAANREKKVWGMARQQCALLCLDRRTGEPLLPEEQATVKEYRDTSTEVHAEPDKHRVEVRSAVGRATFTFTDAAEEKK